MTAANLRSSDTPTALRPDCISLPFEEVVGGDRRLDAEVYLSEGFVVRREIPNCSLDAPRLGELAKVWQPSRLKGIQVEEENGLPFLAATQVFDIWPVPRKFLAAKRTPNLSERYVEDGWILVTCSGTVGNTIRAYSPHNGIVISHDLLRVQPREDRFNGYLYTYLRTRFGRALMRSSHYGNIIKHLETAHLEDVPVAIVPQLVDRLREEIEHVFVLRDRAYKLDMQARGSVSRHLGDLPPRPAEVGFAVTSRMVEGSRSRRLDGYHYNPAAMSILRGLAGADQATEALGHVAGLSQPSRFKRVYGDEGTPYLSSEDLFQVNPEIKKFLTEATPTDLSELTVEAGWLLLACSGQLYGLNGSTLIATEWHEGKALTHDLIRIRPTRTRPGYLQAVLSHPEVGAPLLLRHAYGTSVPHLESGNIAETPVPRLSRKEETEIADAVELASELRMEADKKENGAVARLEEGLERELGKPGERKQRGPLRIPLDFDEAMKAAVQVPPPDDEAKEG